MRKKTGLSSASFLGNKLLVLIVYLFIVPLAMSQEISLEYPDSVKPNEEFEFSVELIDFDEGIYDIKIDILIDGQRVSQIESDGQWKSTFYYLNDAIEASVQETFNIRISDEGSADITIKIRDSSGDVKEFGGYNIDVDNKESSNDKKTEDISKNNSDYEETINRENNENSYENDNLSIVQERVSLVAKTIKTDEISENNINLRKYGFMFFILILGILFIIRLRQKNNKDFEDE
jgi:hypothetical protein